MSKGLCLHCGADLSSDEIFVRKSNYGVEVDSGSMGAFCCSGCEAVYYLIKNKKMTLVNPVSPRVFRSLNEKNGDLESGVFKGNVFDDPTFLKSHVKEGVALFFVESVYCESCVWILENLSQWSEDVESSQLNLGSRILEVKIKEGAGLSRLLEILNALGYPAIPLSSGARANELVLKDQKRLLIKFGVAAAGAGNIMLLTVSEYAGLERGLIPFFNWMSAAFFAPVFLFSSQVFFSGAIRDLKSGRISIDVPLAVAILVGSVISYANLIFQKGDLYFDSLAAIVALLLGARYFLYRIQSRYMDDGQLLSLLNESLVLSENLKTGERIRKSGGEILANERLFLEPKDRLPVDGVLEDAFGYFDLSAISGESWPRRFLKSETVPAGAVSLSLSRVISTSDSLSSGLGKVLKKAESFRASKISGGALSDRFSQIFIFTLAMSSLFFFGFSDLTYTESMNRILALIVVACPCALGVAIPLFRSLVLKNLDHRGIIVRNPTALERLPKLANLFFDKTGTLTDSSTHEINWSRPPIAFEKSILLTLENGSHHPFASLIRKAFGDRADLLDLENWQETPGLGVSGQIAKDFYSIKSRSDGKRGFVLFKNEKEMLDAEIREELKRSAKKTIDALSSHAEIQILSGDQKLSVENIAQELGVKKYYSCLSPQQKRDLIESSSNSAMIGDGINDILAMTGTAVSISVGGSLRESLQFSDIVIRNGQIDEIPKLISFSKKYRSGVWAILFFTISYNLIFGGLAVLGLVSPLVAAIVMPISAFLVVVLSLLLSHLVFVNASEVSIKNLEASVRGAT